MKIDVISIFPEYLEPLKLSLLGKAQSSGLLEINVHNLREHSIGVHGSVDDTPYGGGAGMVMSPEVWAKAIDPLLSHGSELIILTPAGRKFTQPVDMIFHNLRISSSRAADMKELMIEYVNIILSPNS